MQNRTATVKVGLLTTISLLVLVTTVIWLRGRGLGGGQSFEVLFKDVDGLREGAPVQLMGIRVGFVDRVMPVVTKQGRYRVRVKFTVTEPDVKIPRGSNVSLEQSGLIGEKFIELSPPRPQVHEIVLHQEELSLRAGIPIRVPFQNSLVTVGQVKDVLVSSTPSLRNGKNYHYQLIYVINKPGYLPPDELKFDLVKKSDGMSYLSLSDKEALLQPPPPKTAYFTVEEPLRLKDFFEQQLASAESLKRTNEKINQLLSDETIATIQGTLKNSQRLTGQAADVLAQANSLLSATSKDIRTLVASAQQLTTSVVAVSNNVNDIVGDPEVKANIQKTVASIERSSNELSLLLNDPNLKLMLSDAKVTSENAAELMQYLKATMVENDLHGRLGNSITLLSSSLNRLDSILTNVESATEDKEALQDIIQNTRETSENLNRFSERLNKRFLFFRMLF